MSEPIIETVASTSGINPEHQELFDSFVKALESDRDIDNHVTCLENKHCGLFLSDGSDLPCYVVAQDVLSNYIVLTNTGYVKQYMPDEVR